jgi:hypothetical protein
MMFSRALSVCAMLSRPLWFSPKSPVQAGPRKHATQAERGVKVHSRADAIAPFVFGLVQPFVGLADQL